MVTFKLTLVMYVYAILITHQGYDMAHGKWVVDNESHPTAQKKGNIYQDDH